MKAWRAARIASFCKTGTGGTPSRSNMERYYEGGVIPWVKSGELREAIINDTEEHVTEAALRETNVKMVPAGALLIAMYGATVGRLGILGVDATTNQAVCHVIPDPKAAEVRYLFHALSNQVANIVARGVGGAQPNISQGIVRELALPLPPLPEQRRIADVLDRAEALRANRRAALAQLDTLAQSIFIDMFGDPVKNPKGWPNPTLGGLLSFQQYGPRFYNESYSAEGTRIVRITDLSEDGTLNFSAMPRLLVSDSDVSQYGLHPGDLIFARTGATVGKVALIQPDDPPCIAGAYFITMRFASTVEPTYARAVLNAPSIRAIVAKRSRQAAQQNFSGPGLRQLPMPLPPVGLQREFARRGAAVEKLKAAHRASLAELDALFASLQYRAFRGEL